MTICCIGSHFFYCMGRTINTGNLTKQNILAKVSQITIFSTYLNLSNSVIQHCIDTGELICSPIRDDEHPTCGFRYDNKGKLKFRDFSGFFWGDCFDIVALIMSSIYKKQYNVSDKNDFIKILRHITFTFKDIFYGQEKDINYINEINNVVADIKHQKPNIELVIRDWNNNDKEYWKQFGITIPFLNINFIYPIDQYYINRNVNPEPKYYYREDDPCYAYYLGTDRSGKKNIKLYFPKRDKAYTRFITNCNHLEGIYNLDRKDYDIIVITKSTKDRLSIGCTIKYAELLYGGEINKKIGVINIPHETYRLRQNEYDWLFSKLNDNGLIVSLMDNDRTGKAEAVWLRRNYDIPPIIIPKSFDAKDFAELRTKKTLVDIVSIINRTITYLEQYERKTYKLARYKEERNNTLPF